jgi:HAD superfamily hydrolase (TIGR01490 family)
MSETGIQRGRIAAVFDIDGTLLPAPSLELRLLAHLALKSEMRLGAVGKWLRVLLSQIWGVPRAYRENPEHSFALDQNKTYLKGVRAAAAQEWITRRFTDLEFFSEARMMLDWHRRRGHAIVLLSGTLAPLARAVSSLLEGDAEIFVRATELEFDGAQWTGRVTGEAICGPAKERALIQLAAKNHFDLSRSYAYADSFKDRWVLGAVGHSIAVNPAPRLAQHARRCGWRLVNWNDRAFMPQHHRSALYSGAEKRAQILAEKVSWK